MQHILKVQQMSLLPKYIKLISGGFLFAFTHGNANKKPPEINCWKVKH